MSERRALLLLDAEEDAAAAIRTPLVSRMPPVWDGDMRDCGREAEGGVDWGMEIFEEAADAPNDLGLGLEARLESVVAGLSSRSAVRGRLRGGSAVSRGACKRDERVLRPRISGIGRREAGLAIGGERLARVCE